MAPTHPHLSAKGTGHGPPTAAAAALLAVVWLHDQVVLQARHPQQQIAHLPDVRLAELAHGLQALGAAVGGAHM